MLLKDIKTMIEKGEAVDITNATVQELEEIEKNHDCGFYEFSGVRGYGPVNGCVFEALDTHTKYAVAGRSAALFYLYQ